MPCLKLTRYCFSARADGSPDETIGKAMIPAMQTANCFNGPKPIFPENERNFGVVSVDIY